jgi:hypothetical protein
MLCCRIPINLFDYLSIYRCVHRSACSLLPRQALGSTDLCRPRLQAALGHGCLHSTSCDTSAVTQLSLHTRPLQWVCTQISVMVTGLSKQHTLPLSLARLQRACRSIRLSCLLLSLAAPFSCVQVYVTYMHSCMYAMKIRAHSPRQAVTMPPPRRHW